MPAAAKFVRFEDGRYAGDWEGVLRKHERGKLVRGRGSAAPSHAGALTHLRNIEAELARVQYLIFQAYPELDAARSFAKFAVLLDGVQQRLHRLIKKELKRARK